MTGPIALLAGAMSTRWTERAYAAPLVYGFREARRTKDLDAVASGAGRIVYHAGRWPGPDAGAGELGPLLQAYDTGRSVATHWSVFTVHCHGFDAAYPDETSEGAEAAHDDAAWLLMQEFLGVLAHVAPANGWYHRWSEPTWVRDPAERRFGELLRFEVQVSFAVRQAPALPRQHPVPVPTGIVETKDGQAVIINGGA